VNVHDYALLCELHIAAIEPGEFETTALTGEAGKSPRAMPKARRIPFVTERTIPLLTCDS
jgi:hypothetical protein